MEEKIIAWAARNEGGGLYLYKFKPNKTENYWTGLGTAMPIDKYLFPQVKWEDEEPTKVELTIKICK